MRASAVATRLGIALRDARQRSGLTQAQVGDAAGVSQGLVSGIERGHGAATSIETWARLAATTGEQFVAFFEQAPGADRPRDIEHVRRQSALIALAANGGWSALPELAIDDGPGRSRSIDVALIRPPAREAIVVEVWDWLDDVGASLRGLDGKVAALERRLAADRTRDLPAAGLRPPSPTPSHDRGSIAGSLGGSTPAVGTRPRDDTTDRWRVRGLFVLRETRRNRRLVAELRPLFAARFDGSSVAWIRTLQSKDMPMPGDHGLIWADRRLHLVAVRLGRRG